MFQNMFKSFAGAKFWRGAYAREAFKFSLYLLFPITGSLVYTNPEIMSRLLHQFEYVKYPAAEQYSSTIEEGLEKRREEFKKTKEYQEVLDNSRPRNNSNK